MTLSTRLSDARAAAPDAREGFTQQLRRMGIQVPREAHITALNLDTSSLLSKEAIIPMIDSFRKVVHVVKKRISAKSAAAETESALENVENSISNTPASVDELYRELTEFGDECSKLLDKIFAELAKGEKARKIQEKHNRQMMRAVFGSIVAGLILISVSSHSE